MYVTAMWLRSARKQRGVNVYVHWHPDGLPTEPWDIANNPGPDARSLRVERLPPGGNYVEAYVDIVLEDKDYTPEHIEQALQRMAEIVGAGAPNPVSANCGSRHGPYVGVRFSISNLMADPETKRDIYDLLRRALVEHLRVQVPLLPDLASRRPARGVGG